MTTPEAYLSFKIVGDFYLPRYRDGYIIVTRPIETDLSRNIGKEMVVQTSDGEFHVRTVRQGSIKGRYDLIHFSEPTIHNAEILQFHFIVIIILCDWEIYVANNPKLGRVVDLHQPSVMQLAS